MIYEFDIMPFRETLFRDEFWVWQYGSNQLFHNLGLSTTTPELWFIKRLNESDINDTVPLRIGTSYLCGNGNMECERILDTGLRHNAVLFIAASIRLLSTDTNWTNFTNNEWRYVDQDRDAARRNAYKIAYIYDNDTLPVPSASPTNTPTIETNINSNNYNKYYNNHIETLFIMASIIVGSLAVLMSLIGCMHAFCIHKNDLFQISSIIVPFIYLYVKYILHFNIETFLYDNI